MTGSKKGKERDDDKEYEAEDSQGPETDLNHDLEDKQLYKEIGLRIQTVRRHLNYLQKDFAETLNISNASLSEIEAGHARPRFELIYNIIKVHHVNIMYLLYGEGEMFMEGAEPWEGKFDIEFTSEYRSFFRDLFFYFNHSQVVRSAVINYFRSYIIEKKDLIEKDIRKAEEEKRNPEDILPFPGKK
jgi:DNA-binding XRE family transcriptional regulator